MDVTEAWIKVGTGAKWAGRVSASSTTNGLDALSPMFAPFAGRWDAEADRRNQLRTPEHLKALMDAQRRHNSARATAALARAQRSAARSGSRNPLNGARRSAKRADKAARGHHTAAKSALTAARKDYPATLTGLAVRAHAVHTIPAGLTSAALSLADHDLTVWPAALSVSLIGLNAVALWLGRRSVTAPVAEGLSAEEKQLMGRLDPAYWVQHADDRGLSGTVTGVPEVTAAGIECAVRLDGQWTVKKLRAAADGIRALLGARTALPLVVVAGTRGGWAVLRLRTRSAAPDGVLAWAPGDSLGVDMVTGDDVRIPLGHRLLIAGMSGSGKSTASRPLLFDASEGAENVLVIIDLKMVEGRLWDHRARVAFTPEQVVDLVAELVEELTERLEVLPKGQATLIPTAARPRITVVVDEGAEVMSSCTKVPVITDYTEAGKPIVTKVDALEGLDSIARMGRAACIDLWWMTQSPTYGDGVPRQIAKQLGVRIGLAVESPTEARVVFGESAQEKGWKADELPMPGVAMVRDGKRTPDPVKVRYMDDPAVIALPEQPIWRRSETTPRRSEEFDATPAAATSRPKLTLVKQAPAAEETAAAPAEAVTNRDRVLQAVIDGARTGRDITDRTELNKGTVSKLVNKLIDEGALVRAADGSLNAGEVSA